MTNFADFKAAIEGISGGKNTVLLDKFGLPSVVVPINKLTYKDVGVGDDTVLPAFKLVVLPQRIYFGLMRYEKYIMIVMLAAVWGGFLDVPLYYLNNAVWSLLGAGTGYIDKIAYAVYASSLGAVI